MSGRVNHRGWIVLESIQSADRMLCVDFFEDPLGGYGFEHLRTDSEDGGRWTVAGGFGTDRFPSPLVAAEAALNAVVWLGEEHRARQSLEAWRRYLGEA